MITTVAIPQFVVAGIPLVFVIFGLVEFAKSMGGTGKLLTAISFALGVALAILYQITVAFPATPFDWFTVVVIGLVFGIVASGVYDFANARWPATK